MAIIWYDEGETHQELSDNIAGFKDRTENNYHPTCDNFCEYCQDQKREERNSMENETEVYQKTLYDLAIIAEHEQSNGNLVCPRCNKEYHMLEMEEGSEGTDHGPYECWQTHLEMGFCEETPEGENDPKEEKEV